MQTNRLTAGAIAAGLAAALLSHVEILLSRPYKELRRRSAGLAPDQVELMRRFETALQCLSLGVVLLGAGLLLAGIARS